MSHPLILSFDLDDTLWPITPVILAAEAAMWDWLRANHEEAMRGHTLESLRAVRAKVSRDHPDRSHDMTFLRHRAIMEMFDSPEEARDHADQAFEVFFAARNRITLYEDVAPALAELRSRYRLFALSNGNADLKRCGIEDVFEGHITAISAGASKPDARIFEALRDMAGVEADQIVHIGDDPLADVIGAQRAGMGAVWINRDNKVWPKELPPPARTIMSLAEITRHQQDAWWT